MKNHYSSGPVYDIERKHVFAEIKKNVDSLQNLSGPVYTHGITSQHGYKAIAEHAEKIQRITYPVMEIDRQHHYAEIQKGIDTMKSLVSPLYNVPSSHHFNEMEKRVESLKNLQVGNNIFHV